MSAQKMREVVRQVQGLGALEAMAVLQIVPQAPQLELSLAVLMHWPPQLVVPATHVTAQTPEPLHISMARTKPCCLP